MYYSLEVGVKTFLRKSLAAPRHNDNAGAHKGDGNDESDKSTGDEYDRRSNEHQYRTHGTNIHFLGLRVKTFLEDFFGLGKPEPYSADRIRRRKFCLVDPWANVSIA